MNEVNKPFQNPSEPRRLRFCSHSGTSIAEKCQTPGTREPDKHAVIGHNSLNTFNIIFKKRRHFLLTSVPGTGGGGRSITEPMYTKLQEFVNNLNSSKQIFFEEM